MGLVTVRLIPNASCNRVVSFVGGILKIKVMAPAESNRANEALVEFLSKILKIKNIAIVSGLHSKNKILDFGDHYLSEEIIEKLLSNEIRQNKP